MLMRWIAGLVDCAIDRFMPMDTRVRSYLAMTDSADYLADLEADTEVWEPRRQPMADWERELRDAYIETHLNPDYANDVFTLPPDQTADEFVTANRHLFQPAGAVADPPTAAGAGGSPNPVAHVVAVVLRSAGINSAPIYADLIARELGHHFDITTK